MGRALQSRTVPTRPKAGAGAAPAALSAGEESFGLLARSFVCVWKSSTAPFPSKNNEIWDKLCSVCLSSVLWLIPCGYKCSYFIILICNRLLLAVSSQVAV